MTRVHYACLTPRTNEIEHTNAFQVRVATAHSIRA